LRATIDWSHELLSETEKILFRRLSAFASGFTLEAAEAVCSQRELKPGDILDSLGRLVDKSLVIVEPDSGAGETRYRLLETIRQYSLEKLVGAGEAPDIRRRHAEFYMCLAEESEPNLFGNASGRWFRRLDRELDNIRGAIEWSTASGKADSALRILGSLVYFWFAHGLLGSEWNDRTQDALASPEGTKRTLARAKALNGIGFMYWADIYPMDKRSELEEALAIGRELGDPWNIATAYHNLGLLENIQGNYQAARTFLEKSLEIWRGMGPLGKLGRAMALSFLGDVALNQNETEEARSLYEESVVVLKEPGEMNFQAYSIRRLGQLAWREGDYKKATAHCKDSLELNQEVGDPRGMHAALAGFAAIAVAQEKFERAATLMAAVESQLDAIGTKLLYMDNLEYERNLATLREQLNKKTLDKFWAKGKSMNNEEAVAFALEGT
jgi:non-specific serine/threonine protein kinase